MVGPEPATATSRPRAGSAFLMVGFFVLALVAAAGIPRLDHALNPRATDPGLISFLGVGLCVLTLTLVLLVAGLRGLLPKTAVFLGAAVGYNALLIAVKFSLSPAIVYASQPYSTEGSFEITSALSYPGLAAVTAILYAMAFFVMYAIFRTGLQRRLGIKVTFERRLVQLLVVMFLLAVVGGMTVIGLLAFIQYSLTILLIGSLGALVAIALMGAIALCSLAFKEATDQAVMLRNVSYLSTFAWIGLAFIAAYHILWLVFLLTLISLWPLRTFTPAPAK